MNMAKIKSNPPVAAAWMNGHSSLWSAFSALVKMRLTLFVVFSSFMGYVLGATHFSPAIASLVLAGGLLVTFAANAMNQVLEKDFDRLMERTAQRPLVTGRFTVSQVVLFAGISCLAGVFLLAAINVWAALLGMVSFILYAFVYTPLKRIHPIAVLVGAIPGAMPVFIGWVSGSGSLTHEGLFVFSLQFFWQFPHFWAIAWLGFEDYRRAGFRMLPEADGIPGRHTARQSTLYAGMLIVLPLMQYAYGFIGEAGMALLIIAALHYTWCGWKLLQQQNRSSARRLLFASFIYLPVALSALYLDKWLGQ